MPTSREEKEKFARSYFLSQYSHIIQNPYDQNFYDYAVTTKLASPSKDELVLEVGCGLGTLCWVLSKYSNCVIGVDLSKFAVQWGREHYRSERTEFIVASGTHLPFKAGSVDCIVCSHFFEHLYEKDAVATQKECARALTDSGRIVIMQPFEAQTIQTFPQFVIALFYKIKEKFFGLPADQLEDMYPTHLVIGKDFTHKRFYTLDSFVQEIEKCGFTVTQYYIDFRKRVFTRIIWRFLSSFKRWRTENEKFELRIFTWYIRLYLRAPNFLRKIIFIPFKPKILAKKS